MATGQRHRAREVALQALFESDCSGHAPLLALERLAAEQALGAAGHAFARHLVEGVLEHLPSLDRIIGEAAPQWPVEQLAVVDRNVLRLALYELLFSGEVPLKASINEAVELAKTFGSESSPRFVNGVLGFAATHLRSPLEAKHRASES